MMQREQLRRNQPAKVRAALDVIGFRHATIEGFAPQCAGVLLKAPDQPREFAELAIACQPPAELKPLAGRHSSALAELQAEIMAVLRNAIDLFGELRAAQLHPLQLGLIAVA